MYANISTDQSGKIVRREKYNHRNKMVVMKVTDTGFFSRFQCQLLELQDKGALKINRCYPNWDPGILSF